MGQNRWTRSLGKSQCQSTVQYFLSFSSSPSLSSYSVIISINFQSNVLHPFSLKFILTYHFRLNVLMHFPHHLTKMWHPNFRIPSNKTIHFFAACRKNDFRCRNGFCISEHDRCDGLHQCQDGSDELDCSSMTFRISIKKYIVSFKIIIHIIIKFGCQKRVFKS